MRDANHWFPYPGLSKRLAKLTKVNPDLGDQFVRFLLEHRPLQLKLALRLFHTTTVGHWKQNILLADVLHFPESMTKLTQDFTPSSAWLNQLEKVRNILATSQKQTNTRTAFHLLQSFKQEWQSFRALNLLESRKWNHYYFSVMDQWLEAANVKERELAEASQNILSNPFRAGDPLVPGLNSKVFLGRADLKNELSTAIQSAQTMPLFLIQGQRRVGKTSLLNFLQDILGERFVIVQMDLQSSAICRDVPTWMESIRNKVNQALGYEEENWQADPEDWIQSWLELSEHLTELTDGKDIKLILAFDEYESLHVRGLTLHPAKGGDLLANMRAFSQGQSNVVFLFVGAHLFSELENPNWADFFVQSVRLKVGYLSREHVGQLLSAPDDEFDLTYEEGFLDQVYALTQGHPTLVQLIGRELVNRSNSLLRKQLSLQDLQAVIDKDILNEGNNTINVFWSQFCKEADMKNTVREVIRQTPISDKINLQRLLRHDFVIRNDAGTFQMRPPLFEAWIRKFDVEFLEV